jgi:hypothetical protein
MGTHRPPSLSRRKKRARKWKKTRNRREKPRTNWSLLQEFLDQKGFVIEATSSNVAGFRC